LVTYTATLDVPRHIVDFLARLLAAHRRRIGTPRGSRALGPFRQALLVLRWFRERGCVHCLARDAGVSQATGYRYLHEAIDVLAAQAPDLHAVIDPDQRSSLRRGPLHRRPTRRHRRQRTLYDPRRGDRPLTTPHQAPTRH
jgi:hypothetical protein